MKPTHILQSSIATESPFIHVFLKNVKNESLDYTHLFPTFIDRSSKETDEQENECFLIKLHTRKKLLYFVSYWEHWTIESFQYLEMGFFVNFKKDKNYKVLKSNSCNFEIK